MRFSPTRPAASTVSKRSKSRLQALTVQRGVVILPGLGNEAQDYASLATALLDANSPEISAVTIADVSRVDWLRNAAGLIDPNYWKGTLNPRPTVDWYLSKVDVAIQTIKADISSRNPDDITDIKVTLLAHSAGGWLGRLYMKDFGAASKGIDTFLSLGSPHRPPPPGVVDQTRGILTWMEANCPGCYEQDVEYITVSGRYLRGAGFNEKNTSIARRLVGLGYQQVSGDQGDWGDAITPETSSHLPGARQIIIPGAYHSPLGDDGVERLWYGSPRFLSAWAPALIPSTTPPSTSSTVPLSRRD